MPSLRTGVRGGSRCLARLRTNPLAQISMAMFFNRVAPARPNLRLTISYLLYKVLFMQSLDAKFAALADPTRRALLARLAFGEATVNQLAEPFEMTQPAVSQHLKVLEAAGLIVSRVEGTRRPRRLANAGIEAMDQWLAMLRAAMEKNYARLDEVLAAGKKKGNTR